MRTYTIKKKTYNKFFWKRTETNFGKLNKRLFWFGDASEIANSKYNKQIVISKNNVDIFEPVKLQRYYLQFYYAFHWVRTSAMTLFFYKPAKMMFATTTSAFGGLMDWAGAACGGLSSSNRWLGGTISGRKNVAFRPNFIFIPDVDHNPMIVSEALKTRTAIISVISSDSLRLADLPIFGNNKDFLSIVTVVELLVYLRKHKQDFVEEPLNTLLDNQKWFNVLASRKIF